MKTDRHTRKKDRNTKKTEQHKEDAQAHEEDRQQLQEDRQTHKDRLMNRIYNNEKYDKAIRLKRSDRLEGLTELKTGTETNTNTKIKI